MKETQTTSKSSIESEIGHEPGTGNLISFRLPTAVDAALRKEARQDYRTVSSTVRKIIYLYFGVKAGEENDGKAE